MGAADRSFEDEHVLILGGCGFVGSAVTRYLLGRGCRVTLFDPQPPSLRLENEQRHCVWIEGDIRNLDLLRSSIEPCSRVLHLAAVVGVHHYVKRPRNVLDVNIRGSMNVLDACLELDKPVVMSSSSEAYGQTRGPLRESSPRTLGSSFSNRWSYAVSKIAADEYARALASHGLVHSIVRYFNVYGPQMDSPGTGRVISQFLGYIRAGQPLPLVDGGTAVRSFCWIDDAAWATAEVLLRLERGNPHDRAIYNIGRSDPISIRDLADRMIRLSAHAAGTSEVSGECFFGEGFEEIDERTPNTGAIEAALGGALETTLDDGLRRTMAAHGLLRAGA